MSTIALDLRMVRGPMHGIARYAVELARRLPALLPEHRFVALVSPGPLPPLIPDEVERVVCARAFLNPREQLELPFVLERLQPELVHWTSFSAAALSPRRCVITLHDANHLAFPEHFGPLHRLYYRGVVAPVAGRAARVITVSDFAARELERHLGLPIGDTAVIFNGVDPRFHPASEEARAEVRRALGLPERFVLYVGNTKAHKNVDTLVRATALAGIPLVAVVPTPDAGWPRHVVPVRRLEDAQLPALYSAAALFAFPSLYEGFGLPPLEAMACGTPTLVADAASLPEVVGEAVERVAARDVAAWAEAITRTLARPRSEGEASRRARAALFTWEASARAHAEVYRAALLTTARAQ